MVAAGVVILASGGLELHELINLSQRGNEQRAVVVADGHGWLLTAEAALRNERTRFGVDFQPTMVPASLPLLRTVQISTLRSKSFL